MTISGYSPNKLGNNIYEYINIDDTEVDNVINHIKERIPNVDIEADELPNNLWRVRYFINLIQSDN